MIVDMLVGMIVDTFVDMCVDRFVDRFLDTFCRHLGACVGGGGSIPQAGRQRQRVAAGDRAAATSRQLQPGAARSPAAGGRPPAAVDVDVVVAR